MNKFPIAEAKPNSRISFEFNFNGLGRLESRQSESCGNKICLFSLKLGRQEGRHESLKKKHSKGNFGRKKCLFGLLIDKGGKTSNRKRFH